MRVPAPAPSSMREAELRRGGKGEVSRNTLSRETAGAGAGRRHLAQAASSQSIAASQGKVICGQPAQDSFTHELHRFPELLPVHMQRASYSLAHQRILS